MCSCLEKSYHFIRVLNYIRIRIRTITFNCFHYEALLFFLDDNLVHINVSTTNNDSSKCC